MRLIGGDITPFFFHTPLAQGRLRNCNGLSRGATRLRGTAADAANILLYGTRGFVFFWGTFCTRSNGSQEKVRSSGANDDTGHIAAVRDAMALTGTGRHLKLRRGRRTDAHTRSSTARGDGRAVVAAVAREQPGNA